MYLSSYLPTASVSSTLTPPLSPFLTSPAGRLMICPLFNSQTGQHCLWLHGRDRNGHGHNPIRHGAGRGSGGGGYHLLAGGVGGEGDQAGHAGHSLMAK